MKPYEATWNGTTLAESDDTVSLRSIIISAGFDKDEFFQPSDTIPSARGRARRAINDVVVNGETNPDAAWVIPTQNPGQGNRRRIAFWKGVEVTGRIFPCSDEFFFRHA